MNANLRVLPPYEFTAWLVQHRSGSTNQ
jgi:hypothetical protein